MELFECMPSTVPLTSPMQEVQKELSRDKAKKRGGREMLMLPCYCQWQLIQTIKNWQIRVVSILQISKQSRVEKCKTTGPCIKSIIFPKSLKAQNYTNVPNMNITNQLNRDM